MNNYGASTMVAPFCLHIQRGLKHMLKVKYDRGVVLGAERVYPIEQTVAGIKMMTIVKVKDEEENNKQNK